MLSGDENKPAGKPGQRKAKSKGKKAEARKQTSGQQAARPDQLRDAPDEISAPVASVESAPIVDSPAAGAQIAPEPGSAAISTAESLPTVTYATDTDVSEATGAAVTSDAAATSDVAVTSEESSAALASPIDSSPIDNSAPIVPEAIAAALGSAESQTVAPPIDSSPVAVEAISPVERSSTTAASSTDHAALEANATPDDAPVSFQTIATAYGDLTKHSLDQTKSFLEKLAGVKSLDKAFELHTDFARQAYDSFVADSHRIRELHRELAKQKLERWEGLVGMTKAR